MNQWTKSVEFIRIKKHRCGLQLTRCHRSYRSGGTESYFRSSTKRNPLISCINRYLHIYIYKNGVALKQFILQDRRNETYFINNSFSVSCPSVFLLSLRDMSRDLLCCLIWFPWIDTYVWVWAVIARSLLLRCLCVVNMSTQVQRAQQ